tara:strand:+ start:352 stop:519 length:168 start_codon:yes stop_codon:yes gene_type:complete
MSKEERTHGDHMAKLGELNGLYNIILMIQKRITKLETIRELDEIKSKEKENKNVK